jgi:CO/xanthine dehydrogenase Mo-binding subunit
MQAAEVLGLRMEDVHAYVADTNSVGYNDVTGGSRTTNTSGLAAYNAAQKVVTTMTARAAKLWDVKVEELQFEDGAFSSKSDPELKLTFKELATKLDQTGGPVGETGSAVGVSGAGGFGTHIVDVEVDPETGKVDVLRYTSVQDAGKAIHPSYVEGQMQGGAAQGIGWALNEEYVMSGDGAMENATFLDYRMPTAYDLPMIEAIIVEVPNPFHPFGVRGVGETPIVPALAAVANAVHDATGARFPQLPIKPGRILESLAAKNGS